ncbi:MAG: hypothetical protein OQJ81_06755 [Melioribacteraceae bacterium]|nr:hypothetical protein [Melioribacteraceae bacterium]
MKKLSLLTFIIMLVAVSNSFGQITDSDHDFSDETWNTAGEICLPCHTPHNANISLTEAPLWNHTITNASYDLYVGYAMNATVDDPDGSSKLCLSCHDGTIALDSFGGAPGNDGNKMTGKGNIGTDLTNDHPISFTYNTALANADGGLFDPSTKITSLGGTIHADLLSGGQMQCSSCHDPHNNVNGAFLLIDNSSSALCLTCHDK